MYDYQFNISQNGHFLFRTEWTSDKFAAKTTEGYLNGKFPEIEGFRVTVIRRSKLQESSSLMANFD